MRIHKLSLWLAAPMAVLLVGCSGPGTRTVMQSSPAIPAADSADRAVNVAQQTGATSEDHIAREVRHELVMLPYYGVFDNLAYRVSADTVTLMGQVTRPTLKSDAENVVKNIEGVRQVVNSIKVLPPSPDDDRIRMAVFHAVYAEPTLSRYGIQAVPPIHIIVENGQVTLEGVVATEADKNMAELRAKGLSGVFSVTNSLRVGA
jgi:hyperosmotically inducible periplasmic protein